MVLNVHHSRVVDLVVPFTASEPDPVHMVNWCSALWRPLGAPACGQAGLSATSGKPERLGSRHCETDRLSEIAWSLWDRRCSPAIKRSAFLAWLASD